MTRTERWVRIAVSIFLIAVATQMASLWLSIPTALLGSLVGVSGIFGWCPPFMSRGNVDRPNAFGMPDGRNAANIRV